uniref:Lipase n=1 Tax=Arion vulgaris TaxID=1028688 RepID=A0A0B6ZV31_9EUPU
MRFALTVQIVLELVSCALARLSSNSLTFDSLNSESSRAILKHILQQRTWLNEDPEVNMNATQLITSKGFPCENYYVTTDDGYITNIVRIPHGRSNRTVESNRPVVILQHGLVGSCTNFLTNPVNESLAYILADAGADVWLGNSRGNYYSCRHKWLNPKDEEFWQFSFDEMAQYDIPAMVNFIVSKTGVDQVYYVGFSQGTTIGFIAFGENEQVASHIKQFIALAPVAQIEHTKSPIRLLAPFANDIEVFLKLFGHGEINVNPAIMRFLAGSLCEKWGSVLCANFMFILCGFDYKSLNMSRVPVYVAHNPSSTSVRDILHWAQGINSKKFQKFDFGSAAENMKHYNQTTPPEYDPKKVKVPVTILRGGHDWLADPKDVAWLIPQLNVTSDTLVDSYEHLDFIWADDAPKLIYNNILKVIFQ